MERCPNCRARYDGDPACRRCGMALGPLLQIEQGAQRRLAQAIRLLGTDSRAAVDALTASGRLQNSPLADHLIGFVRWRQQRRSDQFNTP